MDFLRRYRSEAHAILRIATGLLFMQHGVQKLFGWLDGRQVDTIFSQRGLAGVLELVGGGMFVLGLFTIPVAAVLAIEMFWAYVQAHLPQGPWPVLNGGELALLYAFIFVYFATAGPGSFSLDGRMRRGSAEPHG